ncbi:MAG: hypothetical protein AB1765_11370 [Candidatus Hydrogenedentota bacterium]
MCNMVIDIKNAEDIILKKSEEIAILLGWTVVDVEIFYSKRHFVVRIYLDRATGITVNDCENFSQQIEPYLEELFRETSNYFIEVSSPGIARILKKEREFKWAIGKNVKVVASSNGKTIIYKGNLKSYNDRVFNIEDIAYGNVELSLDAIKQIRLDDGF